jgi:hypothetical protein
MKEDQAFCQQLVWLTPPPLPQTHTGQSATCMPCNRRKNLYIEKREVELMAVLDVRVVWGGGGWGVV